MCILRSVFWIEYRLIVCLLMTHDMGNYMTWWNDKVHEDSLPTHLYRIRPTGKTSQITCRKQFFSSIESLCRVTDVCTRLSYPAWTLILFHLITLKILLMLDFSTNVYVALFKGGGLLREEEDFLGFLGFRNSFGVYLLCLTRYWCGLSDLGWFNHQQYLLDYVYCMSSLLCSTLCGLFIYNCE